MERKQRRSSTWRSVNGKRVKVTIQAGECRVVLDPFDSYSARYWCRSRWGWGWRRSSRGAAIFATEKDAREVVARIQGLAPELGGRVHIEKIL